MLLTIKYAHAATEKITEFVVQYISLKQSCLNYIKAPVIECIFLKIYML